MRSAKTRGENFTRPSPGQGILASGYLEATACSNGGQVLKGANLSKGPFISNESPVQLGHHRESRMLEVLLQSLATSGKENDRRGANKTIGNIKLGSIESNNEKSLAILNEASEIIKYLQSFVDSSQNKSVNKHAVGKPAFEKPLVKKDQSTSTDFSSMKLRFEASFDSAESENDGIKRHQPKLSQRALLKPKEESKCQTCEELGKQLLTEIDQRATLEETLENLQREIQKKNREFQRAEYQVKKIEQEVSLSPDPR
jgi:hypothetical protein